MLVWDYPLFRVGSQLERRTRVSLTGRPAEIVVNTVSVIEVIVVRPREQPVMSNQEKTLFVPVVSQEKLNSNFKLLMDHPSYHPARSMLDHIYQGFIDQDGNFLEQFQTTAFDARFFELYLYAYFSKSGFEVDQTFQRPDCIVTRNGLTVAVEATTVNPSGAKHSERNVLPSELSPEDYSHYLDNELPMKFGSPLFSKLNEEYWKLDQCKDKPLVLAIEAFLTKSPWDSPRMQFPNISTGSASQQIGRVTGSCKFTLRASIAIPPGPRSSPPTFLYSPARSTSAQLFSPTVVRTPSFLEWVISRDSGSIILKSTGAGFATLQIKMRETPPTSPIASLNRR